MRLMIEYEIIRHDKIKDMRIFVNAIHMRSLHMHHDMELLFVIDGKGSVNIRNAKREVGPGDSILINAYESHEIISYDGSVTFLIIQFSNHFLRDYFYAIRNTVFLDNDPRNCLSEKDYRNFTGLILHLAKVYFASGDLFELQCISDLSLILSLLYGSMKTEKLSETEYSKRKKYNRRIDRIAAYIDNNYQDQIRLSDIARSEGITVTHLSHFISEHFGMTFQEYLKEKRLGAAVRMIANPSLTLSEVAAGSGFSELKYMTAAFREVFSMSPDEYRKKQNRQARRNKKADASEYIYSDKEALALLQKTR